MKIVNQRVRTSKHPIAANEMQKLQMESRMERILQSKLRKERRGQGPLLESAFFLIHKTEDSMNLLTPIDPLACRYDGVLRQT